jgi:hypothetical protein
VGLPPGVVGQAISPEGDCSSSTLHSVKPPYIRFEFDGSLLGDQLSQCYAVLSMVACQGCQ